VLFCKAVNFHKVKLYPVYKNLWNYQADLDSDKRTGKSVALVVSSQSSGYGLIFN